MDWWQAIILGIVEGITEYLPVSSTGHLILLQRGMGISASPASDAYAIFIQAGAIVAILGVYAKRVKYMCSGLMGQDNEGLALAMRLVVAFLPAAIVGLLIEHWIKSYLFGLVPITVAWAVGGAVILVVVAIRRRRGQQPDQGFSISELTWQGALIIGLIQCVAMWPGTSRSLVTILGGVLVGMSLPAAVEFSFLLGAVTLTAATAYEGVKQGPAMFQAYGAVDLVLGFLFAWLAATLAVKWMIGYLNTHSMAIFGYYRIALAILVAALLMTGVLSAV